MIFIDKFKLAYRLAFQFMGEENDENFPHSNKQKIL